MTQTLPSGYAVRAPEWSDLPLMVELLNACDVADYGAPDTDEDAVREDWERSGFDMARDAWLVFSHAGEAAAYASVLREGGDFQIHPAHRGQGLDDYLLARLEARGSEQGGAELKIWCNGADPAARGYLERQGYSPIKHLWRMQIDMEAPPAPPQLPEGITVRTFVSGQDERAIYDLTHAAFRDTYDYAPKPYEEFVARTKRDNFDPSVWLLAFDGDEVVGGTMCTHFLDSGWVNMLGVAPAVRKRGLGGALLQLVFAAFYKQGKKTVMLGVDAENESGATRLYEAAGMRIVRQHARYAKRFPGQ